MIGRIVGMGDKTRYLIDNKPVSKEEFEAAFPDKPFREGEDLNISTNWSRPILSDALAVHPRQVKEARKDADNKGVPVEFLDDGRPVLRSRQQRNQYLRAYGFFDHDAGYGDKADGTKLSEVNSRDY